MLGHLYNHQILVDFSIFHFETRQYFVNWNCLHYDQKLIIASTSYAGSVPIIGQLQIVVHSWIKIFLKSHLDFSASVISQQILLCIALGQFETARPIIQFQMRVHNRFGPNVFSIVINKPIDRQLGVISFLFYCSSYHFLSLQNSRHFTMD